MNNLLFGHDKTVADWASKQSGKPLRNWHFATGIIDKNGLLVGSASWHDMNGSNVELVFFGKGIVSIRLVRGLMDYAFNHLKVNRVTARTPRQNKRIIRALPKLGFHCEGVMKHYYGASKKMDAIVFGLLAENAKITLNHGRQPA